MHFDGLFDCSPVQTAILFLILGETEGWEPGRQRDGKVTGDGRVEGGKRE